MRHVTVPLAALNAEPHLTLTKFSTSLITMPVLCMTTGKQSHFNFSKSCDIIFHPTLLANTPPVETPPTVAAFVSIDQWNEQHSHPAFPPHN
jgi:hypothetical protein